MGVRIAETSDQPAVEAVVAAAFGAAQGDQIVEMIRALESTGATRISIVAVDEQVIGHVQLNRSWLDTREKLVEVLTLSPLSVLPSHQRQGVGTRLLESALAAAEGLAAPAVFLEGDWNYYGPRGFRPAVPLGFGRPSDRIPDPAFQVALMPTYEPSMTGRLVYPEAFWSQDCVGLRDPGLAKIEASLGDRR